MNESLLKKEATSIWKDKKVTIAIFAVFAIPILYAGMFLWAFWDPYTYLDSLPIAVVNEDTGATFEGEHLELGDELVDKLKEEETFDFHFVDTQTGYKGLQNEDYYVLIEIPQEFSEHATTLLDDDPDKMELLYVPNESYNFLAAQMGETAMLEIEAALEEKVIETYADTMFDSVHELADGFETAHEGSSELHDGTLELADGVVELHDGTGALADGTNQLHDGMSTLAEKSGDLKNGLQDASTGASTLTNGIHEVNDGFGQLLDGQQTLINGSSELEAGANTIATNLVDVNAGLDDLSTGMDTAIAGANELSEGATSLS
ncbi:MAG TPA: YhgE/Pip family protein, partial [Bacillota bacterium]|nr:YhgE/Pip family protein [Bacillota bacterium]